jgi:MoaA/NifB/PqqE/SkfB family radical SAM enzyme
MKDGSVNASAPDQITGLKALVLLLSIRLDILLKAFSICRNPIDAVKALNKLVRMRRAVTGARRINKFIRVDSRHYWSLNAPPWPSDSFDIFIKNELAGCLVPERKTTHLQTMIFSITNRCSLKCEHCFEWHNLDSSEILRQEDLKKIMSRFQERGISQIQLSGGEPLCRFNDLIDLLSSARAGTDFWLLTSGYGLNAEKASMLKDAGLSGVNISLDHWDESKHNEFRGKDDSYSWVMRAARASIDAGLALCFSLCATKDFITEDNLRKYAVIARNAGAGFIQILEPRNVGHYIGRDVELEKKHTAILDRFFLSANSGKSSVNMPIVHYPGYHQRKTGCFGAGNRYLYVDSKGDLHACPFCQNAIGNALDDDLDESIEKIKKAGCHKFRGVGGRGLEAASGCL